MKKPKILLLDIETAPIEAWVWGLYDQNPGLNMMKKDWSVIAWAAKWLDDEYSDVIYQDVSKQKNKRSDKKILQEMWKLLDEADIVVTQNGKRFDIPKLNARFAHHGMGPYAPVQHIDTRQLARKRFGFTSSSLEYMADFLGVRFRKLTRRTFQGFDLWRECLAGNPKAWAEMRKYNIRDVQVLQGVYEKLRAWGTGVQNLHGNCASCGSKKLQSRGTNRTNGGLYQRYQCKDCGAWFQGKENLLSKKARKVQKKEIR